MNADLNKLSDAEIEAILAEDEGNNAFQSAGSIARSAIAGGLGAIPDTLSLLVHGLNYGTNKLSGHAFDNEQLKNTTFADVLDNSSLPNFTNTIKQGIDYATNDYFTPKSTGERAINNAVEFIAGGAGIGKAAATGASKIASKYFAPQTARDYAALGSAGIGSSLASEAAPDNPWASVLGGVAGSFVPGAASSITRTVLKPGQTLANLLGINPAKAQAFQQAGLQPTLSNVSDSRFIGNIENTLREIPFASTPLQKTIAETQDKIEALGKGLTQVGAGEVAQTNLRNWQKKGTEITAKLKAKVDPYIDGSEKVPINKSLSIIRKQPKFDEPEIQKDFDKSTIGKFYKKINKIAERQGGGISYNGAVRIRKDIDDEITTFRKYGKEEQGALKHLRDNLQADIGEAIKSKSPKAAKDWERYNKFYTKFSRKNEDIIQGLLENKTATEAFRDITNNLYVDAREADAVLKSLKPEQKQVFSQSLIKELGSNPQNEFTAFQFAKQFKKLEPTAQEIILSPYSKETQKQLRATVDAIDAIKDTAELANKSRTAYTNIVTGLLTGSAGGGALAGGTLGFVAAPIATLVTARGLSSGLFANPKFINWLGKASQIKTPKEFTDHISSLQRIAKSSPEIASDLQEYLESIKNPEQQSIDSIDTNDLNKLSDAEIEALAEEDESTIDEAQSMSPNIAQTSENIQIPNQPQTNPQDVLINKIANIESGGNSNAKSSNTTASGLLQFTNRTWKYAVDKYGKDLGITYKDKNNPQAQKALATLMLKDNAEDLQKILGREPHDTEIYLTHFLGLEGAKKLLNSNPNELAARILPKEAKFNKSVFFENGRPLTVAELYTQLNKKFNA